MAVLAVQADTRCSVACATDGSRSVCCGHPGSPDTGVFCSHGAWHLCDLRTGAVQATRSRAHELPVLAADMACSAPHMLATASQDCTVKVWDCRYAEVKTLDSQAQGI